MLRGDLSGMRYTAHPISVDSRSGHSAHRIGSSLFVIGGRNDKLVERHGNFRSSETDTGGSVVFGKLMECADKLKPMSKVPGGRKHHVGFGLMGTGGSGNGVVFVHGGETFDGRTREPVGEMYLMKVSSSGIAWYNLGVSPVGRAGHTCSVFREKIFIHGGIGGKSGAVHGETYCLEFPCDLS